jgi:pyridoxal/pyridoxine/pyridoxamine kinase
LLTGKQIKSVDDAWQAVEHFHKKGCHTVVLSSTDLGNDENLLALASSRTGKYFISFFFGIIEILSLCFPRNKSRLKRE